MSANGVDFILPSGRRLQYERLSFGIYEVVVSETEALPHTASATFKMVSDFRLIEQTHFIPARPGLVFGVSFMVSGAETSAVSGEKSGEVSDENTGMPVGEEAAEVSGEETGDIIPMTWITRFPAGGVVTSDGDTFEMDRSACDVPIGKTAFLCYSFDHEWEMTPGEWHLELWQEDQLIADNALR